MLFSTALFVLAQGANGAAVPAQASPASGAECRAVLVSAARETPGLPPGHFSANSAMDLDFVVFLARPAVKPRTLRLHLFTPNGYPYQVLTIPFASSPPPVPETASNRRETKASQTTGLSSHEGPPRPSVRAKLPVAGTLITTSSLYGRWKVVPYLDGLSKPCGAPATFNLDP